MNLNLSTRFDEVIRKLFGAVFLHDTLKSNLLQHGCKL